jgi:hypothetical protein
VAEVELIDSLIDSLNNDLTDSPTHRLSFGTSRSVIDHSKARVAEEAHMQEEIRATKFRTLAVEGNDAGGMSSRDIANYRTELAARKSKAGTGTGAAAAKGPNRSRNLATSAI